MPEILASKKRYHVRVRARQSFRESRVLSFDVDRSTLEVAIKAAPIDGQANQSLCRFLADYFEVPVSDVVILKGQSSRHKVIEVTQNRRCT